MKEFNKELNEDIELLKALHAKKDKSSFNDLKAEIMFKHKISKATVYREMKKDRPGSYKKPSYWPPAMDIRMPEIRMVRELLLSGRQGTEIIKIMSKELGINYYWDRFDRARKMGEELPEEEYDPKQTAFARNGRMFLMELFNLPYMAEGNHDTVSINGWELRVSRETYDIMVLQLMKDNQPESADDELATLREEVTAFYQLKASTMYSISELSRSNVPGSGHALKCYREQLEKIKKEEKQMREKKKYLLQNAKIAMVDDFYQDEWMNNPSEYDPIHNNYEEDENAKYSKEVKKNRYVKKIESIRDQLRAEQMSRLLVQEKQEEREDPEQAEEQEEPVEQEKPVEEANNKDSRVLISSRYKEITRNGKKERITIKKYIT